MTVRRSRSPPLPRASRSPRRMGKPGVSPAWTKWSGRWPTLAMIKLALPAGDLRSPVAELLDSAGLPIEGYGEGSRSYRLAARDDGALTARVFREKDIPVQVALGNYDLGICSIAWVKEMQARFPREPIVPLADLGVGQSSVMAAASASLALGDLGALPIVRIASE